MITIEQIRAARALLGWSQKELADRADLSQTGIARLENGSHQPTLATVKKIVGAFDLAGIEFLGDRGLERRRLELRSFTGTTGYIEFFDDVYKTIKTRGGDIFISGVDEDSFSKHFPDGGDHHRKRMQTLKNYSMRCLICEGDYNFASSNYCEYRWTPKKLFEAVPFYVYGDKFALLNFEENNISIYMINHKKIADAFRKQFIIQWQNAIMPPTGRSDGAG